MRAFYHRCLERCLRWFQHFFRLNEDEGWPVVLDRIFDLFAWLKRSDESKAEISKSILENMQTGKIYWLEVMLSSLIATLGLLQNSVAVVIGAMLIAPLLRPIHGLAFSMANGRSGLLWHSIKILFLSLLLAVFVSFMVCVMAPLVEETHEVLVRTSPNLFDFFVAVASAMIASLAFAYKRLYESVAGVAMATALMPPIAVVGIEFFLGNFAKTWGSFLLFMTNLFSILLIGVFMFIFYGFNPHSQDSKKTFRNLLILVLTLAIILVPLRSSMQQIKEKNQLETVAKRSLETALGEQVPQAKLKLFSLDLLSLGEDNSNKLSLSGEIILPENVKFYAGSHESIVDSIGVDLGREVDLNLEIQRTAYAVSREVTADVETRMRGSLKDLFRTTYREGVIVNLELLSLERDSGTEYSFKTVFTLPETQYLSEVDQEILENKIKQEFPEETLNFIWVSLKQENEPHPVVDLSDGEKREKAIRQEWEQFFANQTDGVMNFDSIEIQIEDLEQNKNLESSKKSQNLEIKEFPSIEVSFDWFFAQKTSPQRRFDFLILLENFKQDNFGDYSVNVDFREFPYRRNSLKKVLEKKETQIITEDLPGDFEIQNEAEILGENSE